MKDVEAQEYEDKDVAEKMVVPPDREGIPHSKLLVEHLNDGIDDLVKKHYSQWQIIMLKYLLENEFLGVLLIIIS